LNGEDLYNEYGGVTDFKNYQGLPMPLWSNLTPKIQEAWNTVAQYADTPRMDRVKLEGRELSQIWHAIDYADHHTEAGIPGHGQLLLIAKLAKALGYEYDR